MLFGQSIREIDQYGRLCIQLVGAQSVFLQVADIGVYPLYHFAHQFLRAELKNFVRYVYFVDDVVEAVQSRSGSLVGRIFDDNGCRPEIDQRRTGVAVPCYASAYQYRNEEPFPLGCEINEQIHYIDALFVLVCRSISLHSFL